MKDKPFDTEAEMVVAFCSYVERRYTNHPQRRPRWTIYHETCGWDLLLVQEGTGIQVGIEAKLSLNAKALDQALPRRGHEVGPDYRAVLVPRDAVQAHMGAICRHLGIGLIELYDQRGGYGEPDWGAVQGLPDEGSPYSLEHGGWFSWLPIERETLPEYIPDVQGGKPSPVALTPWKISAIKLIIMLDRFGSVTRKDMKALQISPTRWCAPPWAYLNPSTEKGAYVRCTATPDLRAQHPVNYAEIEADIERWLPQVRPPLPDNPPGTLL